MFQPTAANIIGKHMLTPESMMGYPSSHAPSLASQHPKSSSNPTFDHRSGPLSGHIQEDTMPAPESALRRALLESSTTTSAIALSTNPAPLQQTEVTPAVNKSKGKLPMQPSLEEAYGQVVNQVPQLTLVPTLVHPSGMMAPSSQTGMLVRPQPEYTILPIAASIKADQPLPPQPDHMIPPSALDTNTLPLNAVSKTHSPQPDSTISSSEPNIVKMPLPELPEFPDECMIFLSPSADLPLVDAGPQDYSFVGDLEQEVQPAEPSKVSTDQANLTDSSDDVPLHPLFVMGFPFFLNPEATDDFGSHSRNNPRCHYGQIRCDRCLHINFIWDKQCMECYHLEQTDD